MAGESCNLDKEEAELLKAPSTSSPSPASTTPPVAAAAAPPSLFPKPPTQKTPATPASEPGGGATCGREERCQEEEAPPMGRSASRCSSCQRRVGLTGFRCRCGVLFCARHRHADAHDCSFDYKAAGREEISRANPLVRAAKIIKI